MSRKLLLADDSVTIQKVIGITFVNEDYTLAVADNGDAALEKARSDRPDLILADVFMPGKNGYELCSAVKADPSLAGVPVLLLTGTFEPFDEAKAQACGADGWIAKPFESQTLINRVKELLDKAWTVPAAPVAETVPEPEPAAVSMPVPPPVSAPEVEVEADIWTELVDSEAAPAPEPVLAVASREVDFSAIFTDDAETSSASPAVEAAEDIWSDVSLVEEDLAPASDEPAASELPGDIWAEMDTPASSAFAPETDSIPPVAAEEPALEESVDLAEEDEVMDLAEEDILALDEGDILGAEAVVETPAVEEDFVFVTDETEVDLAAEEDLPPLAEDIFAFEDESAPLAAAEPDSEVATEFVSETAFLGESPVAEADEFVFSTEEAEDLAVAERFQEDDVLSLEPEMPAVEFAEETPVAAEAEAEAAPVEAPAPVVAAVTANGVEEGVRSLSDAELERIVERVARTVIERLAGTILEKIAWEVVPDLAESLIKEELRQIKTEAEQTG